MASEKLKEYVLDISKAVDSCRSNRKTIDFEVINALFQASNVAMFTENDIKYSLALTNKAKEFLQERIFSETEEKLGRKLTLWQLENLIVDNPDKIQPFQDIDLFYEILKQESLYNLQSFIYYMERKRKSEKRFFYPRRKTLNIVLQDLQALEKGDFNFYGLSLPPRVGKSTLCIFFLNWVMLKRPNSHNAMVGHSGKLTKGFFKETTNFITSNEYCFKELYEFWHPNSVLVDDKSAEDCTINLDKPDRFSTLTCRGIDGTWTGAVDVSRDGYLYVDDLVRDREESMSLQRMENLYQTYQNTVLDRKNDGAKEIMVGTLWSVNDPLERTRVMFEHDNDYRFRRIPALDSRGRSNFNYDYNGFSDKYYHNLRKRLDSAEWEAKYQQRPFVREGLLFPAEELRYFNGVIPDPDRKHEIIAVIDPAFGGGDSLSMPICADYGHKERYIIDWVFDTSTQSKTVPKVVNKIIQHNITHVRIERNSGGQLLADNIKKEMESRGCIHCRITLVGAPVKMSKEDKISGYSDFCKEHFIFLAPNVRLANHLEQYKRTNDYEKALSELCMYSPQGRQPHDDAADGLTQLAMMFETQKNGTVEAIHNPFKSLFG